MNCLYVRILQLAWEFGFSWWSPFMLYPELWHNVVICGYQPFGRTSILKDGVAGSPKVGVDLQDYVTSQPRILQSKYCCVFSNALQRINNVNLSQKYLPTVVTDSYVHFRCCERDNLDGTLRRILTVKELPHKEHKGQGLWTSIKLLHGDLKQVCFSKCCVNAD